MATNYQAAAARAVFVGDYIPAHDETSDIAETIADQVQAFHAYVASVRDAEQARAAVRELLGALRAAA